MSLFSILLIGLAMSTDAFAAAIGKGAAMRRPRFPDALRAGLIFGAIEALTPLLGWLLGRAAARHVEAFDHWIAFALLAVLGIKMVWDSLHAEDELICTPLDAKEVLLLAIATSIDALAAGVALAVLHVNIWTSVLLIGLVTLGLSFLGTVLGSRFGQKYTSKAQLVGGLVLCGIGIKILVEHLAA